MISHSEETAVGVTESERDHQRGKEIPVGSENTAGSVFHKMQKPRLVACGFALILALR